MIRRKFFLALLTVMAVWAAPPVARGEESKRVLTVMTRNMDAGTDLNLIFYYYPDLPRGVTATLNVVVSSDLPARAARLADEIRTAHPDFVALQEVSEWRTGACGATTVLYDQLQLLVDALAARNMDYTPLAVNIYAPLEGPTMTPGQCVRFTRRDAILMRASLKPSGIDISNVQMQRYEHFLDLSSIGIVGFPNFERGYISVDVKAGNTTFLLVNTHLETTYVFDPLGSIQVLQAGELIAKLNGTTLPVVLCGDFNSNAEAGIEQTLTVPNILAAGFTDTWRQFNPAGTGFTWPLYLKDLYSGPAVPNERIDLVFTRGVRTLKVDRTGLLAPWASDHAGVAAMLQIGK